MSRGLLLLLLLLLQTMLALTTCVYAWERHAGSAKENQGPEYFHSTLTAKAFSQQVVRLTHHLEALMAR